MEKEKAELAATSKMSVQENKTDNNNEQKDSESSEDKNDEDDNTDVKSVNDKQDYEDQQKANPFLNINTDIADFKR